MGGGPEPAAVQRHVAAAVGIDAVAHIPHDHIAVVRLEVQIPAVVRGQSRPAVGLDVAVLVEGLGGTHRQMGADGTAQEQSRRRLHHAGSLDGICWVVVIRQGAAVAVDLTIVDTQGCVSAHGGAGPDDAVGLDVAVLHGELRVVGGHHRGADALKVVDALAVQLEVGVGNRVFAIALDHDAIDERGVGGEADAFGGLRADLALQRVGKGGGSDLSVLDHIGGLHPKGPGKLRIVRGVVVRTTRTTRTTRTAGTAGTAGESAHGQLFWLFTDLIGDGHAVGRQVFRQFVCHADYLLVYHLSLYRSSAPCFHDRALDAHDFAVRILDHAVAGGDEGRVVPEDADLPADNITLGVLAVFLGEVDVAALKGETRISVPFTGERADSPRSCRVRPGFPPR